MTFGEAGRRAKPRVNVKRGYPGNETTMFTRSAPPNTTAAIFSGQVISLDSAGKWVKGCPQGSIPYIAFHDQTDPDVDSSGKLLGLSCAGDFVIETGYFNGGVTYAIDDPLIAGTGGQLGSVDKGTALFGETISSSATTGDIIGFAQAAAQVVQGGTIPATGKFASTVPPAYDPLQNINSQAALGLQKTLTFYTRWIPARKADATA